MTISVVIPSLNNGDFLGNCLRTCIAAPPFNKEIIVVDGHSTDNTPQVLEQYRDMITVIYDERKGVGSARNTGVRASHGSLIFFLDSDALVAKDHFINMLAPYSDPMVMGVGTEGYWPKFNVWYQNLEAQVFANMINQLRINLGGWSMSIRREAFERVGWFWKGGSEDNEISFRLLDRGYKIVFVDTHSVHVRRSTFKDAVNELFIWGRNAAYLNRDPRFINSRVIRKYTRRRKLYKYLGIDNPLIGVYLSYCLSPLAGLRLLKEGKIAVYLWYIFRQYVMFLGDIRGTIDMVTKNSRYRNVVAED
jgi:glycosyltransferase involved in cell wall biosynthesis